jgi:hypothetical protein
MDDLVISPESLVVFVDDTGHERLVEGHSVYGLGGCAAMGSDLENLVRGPWKEVRRQILGGVSAKSQVGRDVENSTSSSRLPSGPIALIEEAFQDFRIDENGAPIPVEPCSIVFARAYAGADRDTCGVL